MAGKGNCMKKYLVNTYRCLGSHDFQNTVGSENCKKKVLLVQKPTKNDIRFRGHITNPINLCESQTN